jgi:hypothetical protein
MTTAPIKPRHALGLPAGSIRAILALGVIGYLWLLVLSPGKDGASLLAGGGQASRAFIYLQVLMVLILAHFFTAHGKSIGSAVSDRSPLGMPRGSVRLFLLASYLGLAYYMYHQKLEFQLPETGPVLLDLAILVSAFIFGHLSTSVVHGISGTLPAWYQDIQAWFALLALLTLGIIVLIRLVINTNVGYERQIDPEVVEMALAGFVGFYFGARS